MSNELPTVTIIIPTKPDLREITAVNAARSLDYPREKLEIIVARGRQPSVQRNTAIKAARGERIYFLDDDSLAQKENLRRAVDYFRDPNVKMLGGPNLCPPDAPALEKVFALVLASWIAFGPSRARYWPVGTVRESGEKELILCNLVARRDALLELGGFNEALYPNEENALMDELQKRGGKLLYDPQFFVHRRPRRTLKSFCKMLFTYGRGRAEQFRVNPTFGSAMNFVPPLFCVYLVALPFLAIFSPLNMVFQNTEFVDGVISYRSSRAFDLWFVPLLAYFLAIVVQTIVSSARGGFFKSLCAMPLLIVSHVLYGAGFWRGLFTKLKPQGQPGNVPVTLETVSL